MIFAARILSGIVAALLLVLGLRYLFAPDAVQSLLGLTPENPFGVSNIRAMAAPLLMLGIVTAIGAVKKSHEFLTPVAVYFLVLIVSRVISLVADGSDASVLRGLALAAVFFIATEFSVQVIKRAAKAKAAEDNTQHRPA